MDVRWTWCHVAGDTVSAFVRTVKPFPPLWLCTTMYITGQPPREICIVCLRCLSCSLTRQLRLACLVAEHLSSIVMHSLLKNEKVHRESNINSRDSVFFLLVFPFSRNVYFRLTRVGCVLVFQCTFSNWITFVARIETRKENLKREFVQAGGFRYIWKRMWRFLLLQRGFSSCFLRSCIGKHTSTNALSSNWVNWIYEWSMNRW